MLMHSIFPLTSRRSSLIAGLGHDRQSRRLAVKFRDGRVRFYEGVPREIFSNFLAAESLGQFYNRFIKGKFRNVVVGPGPDGAVTSSGPISHSALSFPVGTEPAAKHGEQTI